MSTAILTDYDNLYINDGNTDFSLVTASPNSRGSTKIKRWWNTSYDKVTYVSCALIEISDSYIVVDCQKDVRLKIEKGDDSLSFSVGFDEPGDGNINRILVCPKSELHALTNYDDYYYDYNTKQLKHIQYGAGGITLAVAHITYTISNSGTTFTLRSAGTVDYTVDWGDGNSETSTSNTLAHTYATSGTYTVKVNSSSGAYRPDFNNSGDEDQITSIAIGTNDSTLLGTDLSNAFKGANNNTSYIQPSAATSSVTDLHSAWNRNSSLQSFPVIDTSSCTRFKGTWYECSGLTSFPVLDFSNARRLETTWGGCSGLESFPALPTSKLWVNVDRFSACWKDCTSLETFPANMFDDNSSLIANAFKNAWNGCALNAQSIENILTSLDNSGATNIVLHINGGTNAAYSTWSTAAQTAFANLSGDPSDPSDTGKGWTISYNTTTGTATNP